MASYGQSAPILEYSGEAGQLVDDPEFNLSVENSKSLIKKVLDAIPETHTSCIHSEVSGSASAKPTNVTSVRDRLYQTPPFVYLWGEWAV